MEKSNHILTTTTHTPTIIGIYTSWEYRNQTSELHYFQTTYSYCNDRRSNSIDITKGIRASK